MWLWIGRPGCDPSRPPWTRPCGSYEHSLDTGKGQSPGQWAYGLGELRDGLEAMSVYKGEGGVDVDGYGKMSMLTSTRSAKAYSPQPGVDLSV